jgi:hypothetical protein
VFPDAICQEEIFRNHFAIQSNVAFIKVFFLGKKRFLFSVDDSGLVPALLALSIEMERALASGTVQRRVNSRGFT